MRTQTFIVSMTSALVFAGAAQAAVPVFSAIDSFTTAGSAVGTLASANTGGQFVDETASFGLSGYRQLGGQYLSNSGGFNATAASNSSSSVVIGSGTMSLSYSGAKATSGTWRNNATGGNNYGIYPANSDSVSNQTAVAGWEVLGAGGTISNWSTLTSFSFDIANYSKSGLSTANTPRLILSMGYLTDPTDIYTSEYRTFDITLANGNVSLSRSALTTAGVNLAGMISVDLYLTNTYTASLTTTAGVGNIPSASVDISNFGVYDIPAPGAAALIGLAGLVATRRRRN